jgi:hypothetical protein
MAVLFTYTTIRLIDLVDVGGKAEYIGLLGS